MQLIVKEGYGQDNYRDVARIHRKYRDGLKSGRLARIAVKDGKSTIVAVRGLSEDEREWILLDLETRRRLNVKTDHTYEFELRPAKSLEKLKWAANASDPASRIATWIAIWSFGVGSILGLIGVFLGVVSLGR